MRVCAEPDCPRIQEGTRCTEHARDRDRARGTRQARGYDAEHERIRAEIQAILDEGDPVRCSNPDCLTPDRPVDPRDWHLGHDRGRRHRGPEHPLCNVTAAGREGGG